MNRNQNNVGAELIMHEFGRGTSRVEETAWHCFRKKYIFLKASKFNLMNIIFSMFYELEKYENIRKEETN